VRKHTGDGVESFRDGFGGRFEFVKKVRGDSEEVDTRERFDLASLQSE
jgi:hypothetical protein